MIEPAAASVTDEGRAPATAARFLLAVPAALWGFAVALTLVPYLSGPAAADQMPGWMLMQGRDADGPLRVVVAFILLPFVSALAWRPAIRRLLESGTRLWVQVAWAAALLFGLWAAMLEAVPWIALVPTALAAALLVLLRHFQASFDRHDVLLVPAAWSVFFALLDVMRLGFVPALMIAVAIVFALRLAVAAIGRPGSLPPSLAFALAPLAVLLQTWLLSYGKRHAGWPSLVWVLVTPVVLRLVLRHDARTLRAITLALAFAIYPLAGFGLTTSAGVREAADLPHVDLFEDGHNLMPASEMLRGELPYRDVIPGHGLFTDGLLDYLALRFIGETAGDALDLRNQIASLNPIAIYAVTFAATSSPPAAFLSVIATMLLAGHVVWLRTMPALFALAATISALRRNSIGRFALAGALVSLALLTSLDFGFYALVVLVVGLGIDAARTRRVASWLAAFGGGVVAFAPVAVWFLIEGILDDFFVVTLTEVLTLTHAYSLGLGGFPAELALYRSFPEIVAAVFHPLVAKHVFWFFAVAITAAFVASASRARLNAGVGLVLIGVWIAISAISFAERNHTYYIFAIGTFAVTALWVLWSAGTRSARAAVIVIALLLAVIGRPTATLSIQAMTRSNPEIVRKGWTDFWELPRARYALFREEEIPRLRLLRAYLDANLAPGETFFDFSNKPIFYFLFDRRAPIRQYEVPFYQTEEAQREVIRKLEADRGVRLTLMLYPEANSWIDGVPNDLRAQLVADWIHQNFQPALEQEGIIIWRRRE